ncbi:fumarylacetoacetate hydrolase family protein [Caldinitratiruptor microaerophilus]|uniref:Fumarylacetoacetase-like C-terminal domain-containing protein n=1 Tax=Caldinitratiruptor microaerophilus TaxID=671077 RepID=A0AA35CK35_9FIRM|nr:fumarylacetoacetate hydrolase family protein [Caldinitratiruptor microaerophilus]BDG60577.1 hypothetical protein caldi_16670 [Caldinitratiruptor microaerophilus]
MYLLTFRDETGLRLGVRTERGVLDVDAARRRLGVRNVPQSITEILEGGERALRSLQAFVERVLESGEVEWVDEAGLTLAPAVPQPGKLICVGLNYLDHCRETGMEPPKAPVLFAKWNNALAASGETITLPAASSQVDYEAELAVIIGRRCKGVSPEAALDYVAGYTIMNDVSARDFQFSDGQWVRAKSQDGFAPLGPYFVTKDEVPDVQDLPIRLLLNGQVMQDSSTAEMIFPVREIVSYISQGITLEPGDVIATGTPFGVGMSRKPPVWLQDGDEVAIEIGRLGRLVNRFRRA